MPWSVGEDLCLLVAAAGFGPATKGFVVPSEERQSGVLEERGISPFFATSTMRKVIVLSYYEQYR